MRSNSPRQSAAAGKGEWLGALPGSAADDRGDAITDGLDGLVAVPAQRLPAAVGALLDKRRNAGAAAALCSAPVADAVGRIAHLVDRRTRQIDLDEAWAAVLVEDAWTQVGVLGGRPGPVVPAPAGGHSVAVARSGGFAGMTKEGVVDLDSTTPVPRPSVSS